MEILYRSGDGKGEEEEEEKKKRIFIVPRPDVIYHVKSGKNKW